MDFMYLEEEANVHGTCLKWDTTNLFCLTVVMVIPLSVNVLAKQILDWVVCLMTLQCQECSSPSFLQTTSKHPSLSAPAQTRGVVPVTQPWEVCIFSSVISLDLISPGSYAQLAHISRSLKAFCQLVERVSPWNNFPSNVTTVNFAKSFTISDLSPFSLSEIYSYSMSSFEAYHDERGAWGVSAPEWAPRHYVILN